MSKLVRMIFRFDFEKTCYRYLNEPGTALRILSSGEDGFWQNFGENPRLHGLSGNYSEDDVIYREIYIDPTNVNGTIEFLDGNETIDDVLKDPVLSKIDAITSELFREFEIDGIKRGGARFYVVSKNASPAGDTLNTFARNYQENLLDLIESHLGKVTDASIVVEGCGEDEIFYRAQFGPLTIPDHGRHLFIKGKAGDADMFLNQGYDSLFDVDLFETEFSFKGFTFLRWLKTKLIKARKLIDALNSSGAR